jgi:hypothetical protein
MKFSTTRGAMRATQHQKFKRLVNIPIKPPKGKREQVKRAVIRLARRTYGLDFSPRRIQASWEEYRKWERNSDE